MNDDHASHPQTIEDAAFYQPPEWLNGVDIDNALNALKDAPKLDGLNNYKLWSENTRWALMLGGLWDYVEGTLDSYRRSQWWRTRDGQAQAVIRIACGNAYWSLELEGKSAAEVWQMLEQLYRPRANGPMINALLRRFYSSTMATCGSAQIFVKQLLAIDDELRYLGERYALPPHMMNLQLVYNLTPELDHVKSRLQEREDLVGTDNIMTFHAVASEVIEAEMMVRALKAQYEEEQQAKATTPCSSCGKLGHEAGADGCWWNSGNRTSPQWAKKRRRTSIGNMHRKRSRTSPA